MGSVKLISFRYYTEEEIEWYECDLDNRSTRSSVSSESGLGGITLNDRVWCEWNELKNGFVCNFG